MIVYQFVLTHVIPMTLVIMSKDFDGVLNEFDKVIGVDRIKVVHVNDSKMKSVHIKTVMKI